MLTLIALALLVLDLLFVIAMLRGDVRHARAELRRERMRARIFQEIARAERERGDAWFYWAQHPEEAASFLKLIGRAAKEIQGDDAANDIPEPFWRAWEEPHG